MTMHEGKKRWMGWIAIRGMALICAIVLVLPASAITLYPVIQDQGGSQNYSNLSYDQGGDYLTTDQGQHSSYRNNNTLDSLLIGAGLSAIFGFSFSGGGGSGASLNNAPAGGSSLTPSGSSIRDNTPVFTPNDPSPMFTPSSNKLDPSNDVPEPGVITTLLCSGFSGLWFFRSKLRN